MNKFKPAAFSIDKIDTNVVLTHFQDTIVVVVAQYPAPACVIRVTKDLAPCDSVFSFQNIFNSDILFGDGIDYIPVVRHLAEQLNIQKSAIFFISLKDLSPRNVRAVREVLIANKTW